MKNKIDDHIHENFCKIFKEEDHNPKSRLFEVKRIKIQKKWTKEEDKLLLEMTEKFHGKCWKKISSYFEDKSPLQCFSRYKRIRPGIVKGSWTKEEDRKIINLVKMYGKSWSKISKVLVTRNGKQIRDRYINILDPTIKKGKFMVEEDLKLLGLYKVYGTKWATIAKFFDNRTADMIKNRYHSSIKKNIKFLEEINLESSLASLNRETNNQFLNFQNPEYFFNLGDFPEEQIYQAVNNLDKNLYFQKKDSWVAENTINLTYLQSTASHSPNWKFDDFFDY